MPICPTPSSEVNDLAKYAISLIVPVITAFGGYLLRGVESNRSFIQDRVADIVQEVYALQEVSNKYWSRTVNKNDRSDADLCQEGEIKGRNHAINVSILAIDKNVTAKNYADLKNLVIELRQATSGRNFETTEDRDASPNAIQETFVRGQSLIAKLNQCAKEPKAIWRR